jgi:hypothetical protein
MTDEPNIVKLAAALQATLSPEYIEALTRAHEVFCVLCERVEKQYAAAHADYAKNKRGDYDMGEDEFMAHQNALEILQLQAFAELVGTVGTASSSNRLSRPPGPEDARKRRQ